MLTCQLVSTHTFKDIVVRGQFEELLAKLIRFLAKLYVSESSYPNMF